MSGHDSSAGRVSRRDFLRAATGGAAAAGGVAVTSGSAAAQAATVTVGPGGDLVFEPATVFGMLSTLGLAYFFMRYGGDYETPDE